MRILLLTLYFEPDVAANAVIMSELAEELVSRGHQLTVITSLPHYARNTMEERSRGNLLQVEELEGMKIIRTYLYTSPRKDRFLVRLLNYLSFNVLSTAAGIFSGKQDLILVPSPPLTIGLSAAVISWIKRIPYVYNVQDINPDVLIRLGILKNQLVIGFSRWLERFVYGHAEHITVLSSDFKKNLMDKGVPDEKITIIPNFIDPDAIRPLPKENSLRKRWGLGDNFIVLYAGNLGHSQDLENVLQAAEKLQTNKNIYFVIVGSGSQKTRWMEKAEDMSLDRVIFYPFQPKKDVSAVYASADVCLVPLKQGIALESFPSKIYTILASGKPIIASLDPDTAVGRVVRESQAGFCIPPENKAELVDSINHLYSSSSEKEKMGRRGRQYVINHFTRQQAGEKYDQLLRGLLEKSSQDKLSP